MAHIAHALLCPRDGVVRVCRGNNGRYAAHDCEDFTGNEEGLPVPDRKAVLLRAGVGRRVIRLLMVRP